MYHLKYCYREHCQNAAARVASDKETINKSIK
jgi:hypothetical protein